MESWSSQIDKLKIKVFLDTNILCYLVDNTYPALNELITQLGKMSIVDLISSEFVLTEFIGVRKQEHYFREALKKAEKEGIQLNFSSLLKHNKEYDIPHLGFDILKDEIYNAVKADENTITSDYGINFCCGFNRNLLQPTSDICLSSKISKEDSLVLVSAVYTDTDKITTNKVLLFTNDKDFHAWFNEAKTEIDRVFSEREIVTPHIEYLKCFGQKSALGVQVVNFSDSKGTSVKVDEYIVEYVQKLFSQEFQDSYVGRIFSPQTKLPKQCICFKAKLDTELVNNPYIVIVDKNLGFIYCPEHTIDFWFSNSSIGEKYTPMNEKNNLSFIISTEIDNDIFTKINTEGNLIFIHPDN